MKLKLAALEALNGSLIRKTTTEKGPLSGAGKGSNLTLLLLRWRPNLAFRKPEELVGCQNSLVTWLNKSVLKKRLCEAKKKKDLAYSCPAITWSSSKPPLLINVSVIVALGCELSFRPLDFKIAWSLLGVEGQRKATILPSAYSEFEIAMLKVQCHCKKCLKLLRLLPIQMVNGHFSSKHQAAC